MSENYSGNQNTLPEANTPIIYADRIVSFAMGPAVSKLTFGMEVGPNNFNPTTALVIPTSALLDTMLFMQKSLHENSELKEGLTKGFDAIKAQFDKL